MSFAKGQDLLRAALMAAGTQGVDLDELEATFGCSRRTAQRMIEAVEAVFPALERQIGEDRRARWVLPARAVAPFVMPSAEELAALSAAIAELERDGMAAEAGAARSLAAKVRAMIPPHAGARLATDEEALLEALGLAVRPGPRPAARPEVDSAISEALKGPFLLRMIYKARKGPPAERTVAPHGLLLGVRRYLVARPAAGGGMRHYRVDDIQAIQVLPQSFELDPAFDIRVHAERAFGSYVNEDEYGEVVWRFAPAAAAEARRYLFHPTQVLEDEPDGSLLVRFSASGHLEMCWHLYAWGDKVEVVSPPELREMVHPHRRNDFKAVP
jgi:predicted DNA-binding transcriptional regulator YafY